MFSFLTPDVKPESLSDYRGMLFDIDRRVLDARWEYNRLSLLAMLSERYGFKPEHFNGEGIACIYDDPSAVCKTCVEMPFSGGTFSLVTHWNFDLEIYSPDHSDDFAFRIRDDEFSNAPATFEDLVERFVAVRVEGESEEDARARVTRFMGALR